MHRLGGSLVHQCGKSNGTEIITGADMALGPCSTSAILMALPAMLMSERPSRERCPTSRCTAAAAALAGNGCGKDTLSWKVARMLSQL